MKRLIHEVDDIGLVAADYASGRLTDLQHLRIAWHDASRAINDYENGRTTKQAAIDAIKTAEDLEKKIMA
jgi:hypothetical protein